MRAEWRCAVNVGSSPGGTERQTESHVELHVEAPVSIPEEWKNKTYRGIFLARRNIPDKKEILTHAATRMNLEDIVPSGMSQSQKD